MFKSMFLKITSNAKYLTGVSYYVEALLCNLFSFVKEISYFANGIFTLVYSLYFSCCRFSMQTRLLIHFTSACRVSLIPRVCLVCLYVKSEPGKHDAIKFQKKENTLLHVLRALLLSILICLLSNSSLIWVVFSRSLLIFTKPSLVY